MGFASEMQAALENFGTELVLWSVAVALGAALLFKLTNGKTQFPLAVGAGLGFSRS